MFDVGQYVQTLTEMIATLTGSRIEIVTHVPDQPCFIDADAGQFETALINMAVNARDAMDGGGRLTIAVRTVTDAAGSARLPRRSAHGYVAVSVADTGIGIPQEQFGPSSSPSSPPRRSARAPGLACRRCSASPNNPAAK